MNTTHGVSDPQWPEVEERFLVESEEAHAFLDEVRPHLRMYLRDPDQPVEFVRTTYFDTDALTLFRSELPAGAWRVRIRQYASAPDQQTPPRLGETCAFEVKESTREGRRKLRLVGTPAEIARFVGGGDDEPRNGRLPSLLDHAARAVQLGHLVPQLTTWFRRLSFAAAHARVTLDQRIEFARPNGLGMPGEAGAPGAVVGHGPPLVLEIKLRQPPEGWLADAMRRLFLATEFSKFRDGVLALRQSERKAEGSQSESVPGRQARGSRT